MKLTSITVLLAATAATSALAAGRVIYAGGAWAAIDHGNVCEALTRSQKIASRDKPQASAGFAFTPDHRRWGEFHAQLSRIPRPGSSVMLQIGNQPFLLIARGNWAWSRGAGQEQAIISAVRNAASMRIEARDVGGARFFDPYLLDGVPTAIDAAAARCSLRGAGKIQ
jgi:hypothetical protein